MFDWFKKGEFPRPEHFAGELGNFKNEAERQVKAIVQGILSRMDLVSRDELDVQLNVLMRTREKLEALETRLASLEERLSQTSSSDQHKENHTKKVNTKKETEQTTNEPSTE